MQVKWPGVTKMNKKGLFHKGSTIVCTLTSHGLRDPENAVKMLEQPVTVLVKLDCDLEVMNLSTV